MMRLSQGWKKSREIIENKYTPPVQIFHAMVLLSKTDSIQPVILHFLFKEVHIVADMNYWIKSSCLRNSLLAKG